MSAYSPRILTPLIRAVVGVSIRGDSISTISSPATVPAIGGLRVETERFQRFTYDVLIARDMVKLGIFWLRDESLEDADGLPPPEETAAEIIENLEVALEEFRGVAEELGAEAAAPT